MSVLVVAFYKFAPVSAPSALRERLHSLCEWLGIRGTLLIADEGINGSVAGPTEAIRKLLDTIKETPGFEEMEHKEASADAIPFRRLKVRVKDEIVTMRRPGVSPLDRVGTYVPPTEWNSLISRPDVTVIDARNSFEFEHGTFQGAVDPKTVSFAEFPEWIEKKSGLKKDQPVAMFCTGGIRCEKATSFLLQEGYTQVYHLEGGILRYLNEVPEEQSLWRGECFVFDERVSVGHEK
ncbi:MAG: UPF0176 protein [Bradymonadia bacterium]|jgi:UPF0176 protein